MTLKEPDDRRDGSYRDISRSDVLHQRRDTALKAAGSKQRAAAGQAKAPAPGEAADRSLHTRAERVRSGRPPARSPHDREAASRLRSAGRA
jgi:hypothetical protein